MAGREKQKQNRQPNIADSNRTHTNGKRISLRNRNVIALFDLKSKFTRSLPAQYATERCTECTRGVFCASVDSAIFFYFANYTSQNQVLGV